MITPTPPPCGSPSASPNSVCTQTRIVRENQLDLSAYDDQRFCGLSGVWNDNHWSIAVYGNDDKPGRVLLGVIRCEDGKLTLWRPK